MFWRGFREAFTRGTMWDRWPITLLLVLIASSVLLGWLLHATFGGSNVP